MKYRKIQYIEAVNEALREEMERDERVFIIGEDVGLLGGGFGATKGLLEQFGEKRVRETPIAECGFTGLSIGAAMTGLKPVVEIMYLDFITTAMDQVINQAAKLFLMSGGKVNIPLVIRAPYGIGTREAAQHSQSLEAWFVHTPGLKVVMPSTPYDAKGLLKTCIRQDKPVIFIENRLLYFKKGEVPENEYLIPLGQADIKMEGSDITIVAISNMVSKALEAAKELAPKINVEIIDLRTLAPLDTEKIVESVKKTNRLLILHEAPEKCGIGAEILRATAEKIFDYLDAPPRVLGGLHTPIPFSPTLEDMCTPDKEDIKKIVIEMIK
jgi:pyruvate dehydrogenase E1 component beta subunit